MGDPWEVFGSFDDTIRERHEIHLITVGKCQGYRQEVVHLESGIAVLD
jgi:hypothetical protein